MALPRFVWYTARIRDELVNDPKPSEDVKTDRAARDRQGDVTPQITTDPQTSEEDPTPETMEDAEQGTLIDRPNPLVGSRRPEPSEENRPAAETTRTPSDARPAEPPPKFDGADTLADRPIEPIRKK